ncbi:alpha/beta hydrolase-fold protein [Labrenzia sp. CE80]|uniref:alpha/beta hydrolase n=1 Tax=Labrenzia sp. CE80 TaxID=1788986 RepID=UPI00129B32F2|nr:alpha/beta hydrolase-fold protein [Labrenzia sp. CE80]
MPVSVNTQDFTSAFSRSFAAGEDVLLRLDAKAGTFLQLVLKTEDGAFDIDLQTSDLRHVRRFLEAGEGRRVAMIVASEDNPVLAVHANLDGTLHVSLEAQITQAEQIAPKEPLLSSRLSQLSERLAAGETTASFWEKIAEEGTPLLEDGPKGNSILTFLARGAQQNVRLLGGPTNDHYPLHRLGDSDVWYRSMIVPAGTLFSYRLAPDVPDFDGPARMRRTAVLATAQADPYNKSPWPETALDAYNQQSTFRVPPLADHPWHEERGHPKGEISHLQIESSELGNTRDMWIYRSAGFEPAEPDAPLLIVFDGERFRAEGSLETVLDNLVAEGAIPPLAAVFLSPIDLRLRAAELPDNDAFANFVAEDVMALVEQEIGFVPRADRTVLAGASFGGIGSATIALKHPDRFGKVLSMSGSYWWHPKGPATGENHVARLVADQPRADVEFFLSAGLFETARDGEFAGILMPNRHLRDVLIAKDYRVHHREYPAAHDMFAWREILPDGLVALLGD